MRLEVSLASLADVYTTIGDVQGAIAARQEAAHLAERRKVELSQ